MLHITILTLFPEVITSYLAHSIVKRAAEKGAVSYHVINLRDFAHDERGTVDERPYGGSAGMLLKVEPLVEAIEYIEKEFGPAYKVLLTPSGELFTQVIAQKLATDDTPDSHILLICGHYEGFDERIKKYIDRELSIGSFVLSGGEAAAIVVTDAIVRLLPGVLKKEEATREETFWEVPAEELYKITGDKTVYEAAQNGKVALMEYPQYTRPADFRGAKVPEILQNGNHAEIRKWQLQKAWEATKSKSKSKS